MAGEPARGGLRRLARGVPGVAYRAQVAGVGAGCDVVGLAEAESFLDGRFYDLGEPVGEVAHGGDQRNVRAVTRSGPLDVGQRAVVGLSDADRGLAARRRPVLAVREPLGGAVVVRRLVQPERGAADGLDRTRPHAEELGGDLRVHLGEVVGPRALARGLPAVGVVDEPVQRLVQRELFVPHQGRDVVDVARLDVEARARVGRCGAQLPAFPGAPFVAGPPVVPLAVGLGLVVGVGGVAGRRLGCGLGAVVLPAAPAPFRVPGRRRLGRGRLRGGRRHQAPPQPFSTARCAEA